jgi:transcriptional regulator NrdR family protein
MSRLTCPNCKELSSAWIYDTRADTLELDVVAVVRRRECPRCLAHYKTVEVAETELFDYALARLEKEANDIDAHRRQKAKEHQGTLASELHKAIEAESSIGSLAGRGHLSRMQGSGSEES